MTVRDSALIRAWEVADGDSDRMALLEAFIIGEGDEGVPFLLHRLEASGPGSTDSRAVAAHVLSVRGETAEDARRLAAHLEDRSLNVQEVTAYSLAHFAGPEVAEQLMAWARKRLRRWQDGRGIEVPALLLYAGRNHLMHAALEALGGAETVVTSYTTQMGGEGSSSAPSGLDSLLGSQGRLAAWLAEHNLSWQPAESDVLASCDRLLDPERVQRE